jgi:hypothetical protein
MSSKDFQVLNFLFVVRCLLFIVWGCRVRLVKDLASVTDKPIL